MFSSINYRIKLDTNRSSNHAASNLDCRLQEKCFFPAICRPNRDNRNTTMSSVNQYIVGVRYTISRIVVMIALAGGARAPTVDARFWTLDL